MRLEMGDLSWLTDEQMARLEPFSRRAMGNLVWMDNGQPGLRESRAPDRYEEMRLT